MMNDDSMGGGVELSIPDIEIVVGTQTLSTTNGDFAFDYNYGEVIGWLDYNYEDIVQSGEYGNYIDVDSVIISAECELRDGYEKSLSFTDAQVTVFNTNEYGLCAEIRVYVSNGFSFRIFLVFADSVPSEIGDNGAIIG